MGIPPEHMKNVPAHYAIEPSSTGRAQSHKLILVIARDLYQPPLRMIWDARDLVLLSMVASGRKEFADPHGFEGPKLVDQHYNRSIVENVAQVLPLDVYFAESPH